MNTNAIFEPAPTHRLFGRAIFSPSFVFIRVHSWLNFFFSNDNYSGGWIWENGPDGGAE
jgi:hypothetical protein